MPEFARFVRKVLAKFDLPYHHKPPHNGQFKAQIRTNQNGQIIPLPRKGYVN